MFLIKKRRSTQLSLTLRLEVTIKSILIHEHQDEITGINISPTRINTSQLDQDIIKLYRG